MSPYPWRANRASPNMRDSYSNDTALDLKDDCEPTHNSSSALPHVNTRDRLITSNQTVCRDYHEAVNPMQVPALSTSRRLLYGLAAPPSAMCGNILGFLMSVYLLEVAKLTPSLVLTITFAGRFWDAISDPLIGYLVTITNTRWGKCRIWVLSSAPFCGLSFFLFFHTPHWQSLYGRFAYYFVVYFAFCTFLTTYHIPYTSMTMLISSRSVDRDTATTFRMIFEMVGTLFGVMTFTFITQHGEDRCDKAKNATTMLEAEVTPEEEARYRLGAGIIAAIVLLCGCVGFFGTKEVVVTTANADGAADDAASAASAVTGGRRRCGMLATFRRCLHHRPYLLLMLTFMLSSLAIQTVQNSLAMYTIYSLKMKPHLKFAIAIVMTTAILATPMVFFLIKQLGKKRVFYVGLFLIIPVCLSAWFCPGREQFVPQYYVTMVVAGCYVSINMLLPWIMLPDVIDDYTVTSGGRRDEAAFYSLYVFFNKFAVGISTACLQMALHLTGYKEPPACQQPYMVGIALRGMMGPLPIVLVLGAFCVLYLYPITPEYRQRLDLKLQKFKQQQEQPIAGGLEESALQHVNGGGGGGGCSPLAGFVAAPPDAGAVAEGATAAEDDATSSEESRMGAETAAVAMVCCLGAPGVGGGGGGRCRSSGGGIGGIGTGGSSSDIFQSDELLAGSGSTKKRHSSSVAC